MMKRIVIILCLMAASCATKSEEGYCPSISIVPDASFVTKYEEGTTKVYSQAVMRQGAGHCTMEGDVLTISGEFDVQAVLGEVTPDATYVPLDYLIAVLDGKNNVVLREEYTQSIKIRKNRNAATQTVRFNEVLDLNSEETIPNYNILLSFQLTEDELEDNRSKKNPY